MQLTKNVYLVGFMGSGKSTIARKIARNAGVASLDMDRYIERSEAKSINDIFTEGGEPLFRDIELKTLEELSGKEECLLISCGGGIIETQECRDVLSRPENFVIHLHIDPDNAASRIGKGSKRPMFKDPNQARDLSMRRLPLYDEVADATVDTNNRSAWEITNEVMDILREKGILCQ